MAGTIVNNMANLNGADADTGWSGASASLYTAFPREETGCLGEKVSATNMEAYVTPTGSPRNMSNETIHGWSWMHAAPDTYANGGFSIIVGDGTNRAGFPCGGSNVAGYHRSPVGWQCFILSVPDKLDGEAINLAGTTASIDDTQITQVGYYLATTTTALGNVDNTFWDVLWAYTHTGYAVEITAGTSGSPATFSDLATYDASVATERALGVLSEVASGVFSCTAPIQVGDDGTGSSYFNAENEEIIFEDVGHLNNHKFRVYGNSTGTNEAYFTGFTFRNAHSSLTPALLFNTGNVDNLEFDGCVFLGVSVTFSSSADVTGHVVDRCVFDGCVTITPGDVDFDNCIFANTTNTITVSGDNDFIGCSFLTPGVAADGAALTWNGNYDPNGNLDNTTFSKGTNDHHAIEFGTSSPLTMTLTDIDFSGFTNTIGNNAAPLHIKRTSGTVTINLTGCSGITSNGYKSAGAIVVIQTSVPLEISGVTEGTRCSMIGDGGAEDGNELLSGYATSAGKVTGSFGGATPQTVIIRARNSGIINAAILEDPQSTFTDYTDDARDSTGSNDVTLLATSPAINDAFYFGGLSTFGKVRVNVSTAATASTGTWEYYNGSWVSLTVTDDTTGFTVLGYNYITFSIPGDWATTTVNSQGPFYYIRFRNTASGTGPAYADRISLRDTTRYKDFEGSGIIVSGTGLTSTAVWIEDTNAP